MVTEPVVRVDTDPAGNTATFLATIDSCRGVTVRPQFSVDVTIEQVTNLAGFDARLGCDPTVLKVTRADYNYFLATAGTVTNWGEAPTPQNPDTDGTLSMVAALFPLPDQGASGEGVVAQVTLQAVASGLSDLNLSNIKLPDINNQPIGDEDGDDLFDGPVANGGIAVDQPCSGSTPTPAPTPMPTPTADPPVGGFAELPDVAAPAGGSGLCIGLYAIVVALVALPAATLAAWCVWRERPSD